MDEKKEDALKKDIEAILFAAGRKVELDEILQLTKENDKNKVEDALQELKKEYDSSDSPMFVIQEGDGWKMTVKERYLGVVKDVAPHTELNKALLETLAIIAWKQPVYQSDVIKIRGSTAYEHIRDLVDMGFITKVKEGRSYILKPSTRFFDYFDLPSREAVKEVFKDVELSDAEKRKELGVSEEEQMKIDDSEKLGNLQIYEKSDSKELQEAVENAEDKMETEKLGKLEVFEESEEGDAEEDTEESESPEADEAVEEDSEMSSDEDRTKRIVNDLMEEESEDTGAEDSGSQETDPGISSWSDDSDEEAVKKKSRLAKELEEFAGIGDEENKEDAEEQQEEESQDDSDKDEE
ncbi:SMC-Scp complex subunit ScpB [Candidatus Woesearchaeota archaeon]|nr:SMC-Scp complex subunit ScpB [Candidatus Woesearchaeota archaeon]